MPSGRTHDRITLWSFPWLVGVTYLITRNGEITLIVASGFLFSGLMFGPDLDIYSRQYQRWGKLRYLWIPYQKLFRHRSFLSHGFLIGTLLRLVYFLSFMLILLGLGITLTQLILGSQWNALEIMKSVGMNLIQQLQHEAIALFVGLELGAMSHYVSDWLASTHKRLKSPKKSSSKGSRKQKPKVKSKRS